MTKKKHDLLNNNAVAARYALDSLLVIDVILIAVGVLSYANIYLGITYGVMTVCLILAGVLTLVVCGTRYYCVAHETKWSGYVIIGSFILLVLLLSTMLCSYVTLALVMPMILAELYSDRKLTRLAFAGSMLCAAAGPFLAYFLNTFSFMYLSGYMRVVCHVIVTATPLEQVNVPLDLFQMLLFFVLPNWLILAIFQVTMTACTKEAIRTKEMQKTMEKAGSTDLLTGLNTRAAFLKQAEDRLNAEPLRRFVIVVTDIGKFRLFNETYGHSAGDELLRSVAERLVQFGGEKGLCGRLGDDHMVLLMPEDHFRADQFNGGFLNGFSLPDGIDMVIHLHAGLYYVENRKLSVSGMTDRALLASHSSRDLQENVASVFRPEMLDSEKKDEALVEDISRGLTEHEFTAWLQPQTDQNGNVFSAEVLCRWKTSDGTIHSPGEFIPACERTGMISELDRQIWQQACALLQRWKQEGRENITLSVNISPIDLYRINVYDEITSLVSCYGLKPEQLHLEITETAMMMNLERQIQLIERLREAGFEVEMDDFGSGYSSLGMLKNIRVDTIKMDMAFLKGSSDPSRDSMIMEAMIHLGLQLGLNIIAEGVETEDQLKLLTGMGCRRFQGFYFSRPLSLELFEEKYMAQSRDGKKQ